MIKEKKTPKITVNNTEIKGTTTIVYGDSSSPIGPFGCEHGRRVGQPCPHCMGIGAASPTVNARGFAEGVPDEEPKSVTNTTHDLSFVKEHFEKGKKK